MVSRFSTRRIISGLKSLLQSALPVSPPSDGLVGWARLPGKASKQDLIVFSEELSIVVIDPFIHQRLVVKLDRLKPLDRLVRRRLSLGGSPLGPDVLVVASLAEWPWVLDVAAPPHWTLLADPALSQLSLSTPHGSYPEDRELGSRKFTVAFHQSSSWQVGVSSVSSEKMRR
jgi:hypothetical protein